MLLINQLSLESLPNDYESLRKSLMENRFCFSICPKHDMEIKLYCVTCHMGICELCVPEHETTENEQGAYLVHNLKYFDNQVRANEVGFVSFPTLFLIHFNSSFLYSITATKI